MLLFKMTLLGAQSRRFFIAIAAWLCYTITITERAPFTCGISQLGDTEGMATWNDLPALTSIRIQTFSGASVRPRCGSTGPSSTSATHR
jgi:uncharacterized protein YmfQ (DUF2313 family)